MKKTLICIDLDNTIFDIQAAYKTAVAKSMNIESIEDSRIIELWDKGDIKPNVWDYSKQYEKPVQNELTRIFSHSLFLGYIRKFVGQPLENTDNITSFRKQLVTAVNNLIAHPFYDVAFVTDRYMGIDSISQLESCGFNVDKHKMNRVINCVTTKAKTISKLFKENDIRYEKLIVFDDKPGFEDDLNNELGHTDYQKLSTVIMISNNNTLYNHKEAKTKLPHLVYPDMLCALRNIRRYS